MQESSPQVRQLPFSCVEEAEALLRRAGLPIELLQLEGGAQEGDLLLLRIGPLQLLRIRLARGVHVTGPKPPGVQLITLSLDPPDRVEPLRAHGHLRPGCSLFGLDSRGEIHLTAAAASHLAVLSIDRERFGVWADALGAGAVADGPVAVNWVSVDPLRFEGLRLYLSQLFSVVDSTPEVLGLTGWNRLVAEDVMPLVVEALTHGAQRQADLLRPPARIEVVKLAQRWMRENPRQPITLDALCRQVHAGRRSLIQGFRDHLGMGPMAYLKCQRLHAVRRLLLAADPRETRVHRLAGEWGFLNPGHFAREYRCLFGELPSTTLERAASQRKLTSLRGAAGSASAGRGSTAGSSSAGTR
ncbi:MAG: helix-turn-helix domain-containing protein [Synechococcaceae cyanobacterium]|nr:helix-turn-helix domain-containing protein [Synechococcaceae cyanobacterium]